MAIRSPSRPRILFSSSRRKRSIPLPDAPPAVPLNSGETLVEAIHVCRSRLGGSGGCRHPRPRRAVERSHHRRPPLRSSSRRRSPRPVTSTTVRPRLLRCEPVGVATGAAPAPRPRSTATTTRRARDRPRRARSAFGTAQNPDFDQLFWHCAPGNDPAKGHLMTGLDTLGYNIAWFSPKPSFSKVTEVCWDINETGMSHRKWTQVLFVDARPGADATRYPAGTVLDPVVHKVARGIGWLRPRLHEPELPTERPEHRGVPLQRHAGRPEGCLRARRQPEPVG